MNTHLGGEGSGKGEKAVSPAAFLFTQLSDPLLSSHSHQVLRSSHTSYVASGHGEHFPKPSWSVLQELSEQYREKGSPYSKAGENNKHWHWQVVFSSTSRKPIYYERTKLTHQKKKAVNRNFW